MESKFLNNLEFTVFGGSHEKEIGIKVNGLPKGFKVDENELSLFLKRRAPGKEIYETARKESDLPEFLSGIENGILNGETFIAVIKNNDVKDDGYSDFINTPRPSHADYTATIKYGEDAVKNGWFSGRMTAPLCILGGICIQILKQKGISINSRIKEIGGTTEDLPFTTATDNKLSDNMKKKILSAKTEGDSLGGIIECRIIGVPAGLGEPMFGGIESRLSTLLFSVPAVKGIEFGSGFSSASLKGSENNDAFTYENGKIVTKTNNSGGILGGITNGMPINFKVAIKPTPSIAKKQETVDIKRSENTFIEIKGRHDSCIVPRAVPVIEAVSAIAIYDIILAGNDKSESLENLRKDIDLVDIKLVSLFAERLKLSKKIAEFKQKNAYCVTDKKRENEKLSAVLSYLPPEFNEYGSELYNLLFSQSKDYQNKVLLKNKKFGLLGKKLSHSFSPVIHSLFGGYNYQLFETDNLGEFFKNKDFSGINVTVPYKTETVEYMDNLSKTATTTNSVNTVIKNEDGTLTGYNTDVFGFLYTLNENNIDVTGKKVIVLGSGGASKSVCYVLNSLGADVTVISRNGENNYTNLEKHFDAQIIVNTTPIGMFPEIKNSFISINDFSSLEAVIDLIYNPLKTELLLSAEQKGIKAVNGLMMLCAQAAFSSQLFTGREIKPERIKAIYKKIKFDKQNIVLIGMPSVGKTTVAETLGKILSRKVYDTDNLIKEKFGETPSEIIKKNGEEFFRKLESEVIDDISANTGVIISSGGGAILKEQNIINLSRNGTVIWLKRDIEELSSYDRPLSKSEGIENLYNARKSLYEKYAEYSVNIGKTPFDTAKKILEELK